MFIVKTDIPVSAIDKLHIDKLLCTQNKAIVFLRFNHYQKAMSHLLDDLRPACGLHSVSPNTTKSWNAASPSVVAILPTTMGDGDKTCWLKVEQ